MITKSTIRLLALLCFTFINAQQGERIFEFSFEGVTLNGILNAPQVQPPKGIILIVHGSGRTDAVAQDTWGHVRRTLVKAGYATYMWDKMGCGKSEGTFDYNQPVANSADEAIAAIHALKKAKIEGSSDIGLWGISRAGWICPIIMERYSDIRFWISVSGVDDKENFNYLIAQNLRIAGYDSDYIEQIGKELVEGTRISHEGGSYEAYRKATSHLAKDPFWLRFTNGGVPESGYYAFQKEFKNEILDEASGLQVYIKDFDKTLRKINCPVLALFGEKDMNVDWTKTKALSEKTIAPNTSLTVKSFPNCNHNLAEVNTGAFYEYQDTGLEFENCVGFLEAMTQWLATIE